jgi:hypothetical protein
MTRTNAKTNESRETLAADAAGVSLIERLRKGTDHSKELHWPGSDERIVMRVLSCTELQEAQSAATVRWDELKLELNLYTSDDYYSELTTQLLARSMRTLEDTEVRLFPDASELRSLITPDERSLLASEYIEIQQYANPDVSDLNPQTLELIRQAVKKKDVMVLSAFGSSMLAIYIIGMESPPES